MGIFDRLFGRGKKQTETKAAPQAEEAVEVVRRDGQPDVYFVETEEQAMNAAMAKARLNLDFFLQCLKKPRPGQQFFSLKARLKDNDLVEHIWLNNVTFDNEALYGMVNNDPVNLTNIFLGQQVGVARDAVSDWMIIENGRLLGGYTVRALRKRMPEAERAVFDRQMGFIIDGDPLPDY